MKTHVWYGICFDDVFQRVVMDFLVFRLIEHLYYRFNGGNGDPLRLGKHAPVFRRHFGGNLWATAGRWICNCLLSVCFQVIFNRKGARPSIQIVSRYRLVSANSMKEIAAFILILCF